MLEKPALLLGRAAPYPELLLGAIERELEALSPHRAPQAQRARGLARDPAFGEKEAICFHLVKLGAQGSRRPGGRTMELH